MWSGVEPVFAFMSTHVGTAYKDMHVGGQSKSTCTDTCIYVPVHVKCRVDMGSPVWLATM